MVLDEDKGVIIDLDGNDEEDDGMNERLWDEVAAADSDLITLAECDHHDDFWQPRLASAFHDMHRAQPLDHRGASGKRSEHVTAFAAESRSDARAKYVVVANTAASELDDPVRISVEDLGLKPYLVPGDTGPQLNALSGRSYFVTDLYTNVTFPIGAGLLGAPKPRGSSSYIVREMPCNESMQYACSRRAGRSISYPPGM